MITDKELAEKLQVILDKGSGDQEVEHCDADELLCDTLTELGFTESVSVYRNIPKWFA